jgi:3-oxoisoapionate decarboxylase
MTRRTFLQAGPAAAAVAAVPPANGPGLKLGFDTYSIRDYKWKALQLLDYAASLKLDTIQISSTNDYEGLEPAPLQKVKDTAERYGISIDAGTGCICPSSSSYRRATQGDPADYMRKGLRVAHAVGSKSMRCYLGASPDRRGAVPLEQHMENTVRVFKAVRNEALDLGVKIAVENHSGDMQAREVRTLIEEAGRDYVAACLDTGNPMWVIEDPMVALETLAPYIVTTHIRDSVVFEHPRGAAAQWVAQGEGSIDYQAFVDRFRELCPTASVQLEVITGRPPTVLPYNEPDFWKAFPNMPAWEFARFLQLVKKGHPLLGPMVIADVPGPRSETLRAALKEQQKSDLERSLEFAKRKLGLGIRWRAA